MLLVYVVCLSTLSSLVLTDDTDYFDCQLDFFTFPAETTDSNGKHCRGTVTTQACRGFCMSEEKGSLEPPYSKAMSHVCSISSYETETVNFTDCDDGVETIAKSYSFASARGCDCRQCKKSDTECLNMHEGTRLERRGGFL